MSAGTLLVADDEPQNLELIRMVVEDANLDIRLTTASNGLEAVRLAQDLTPRLVLMDLKMPVLDGWEATKRLKADPATRRIPVIAVSAQAMAGDRERAMAAGCDGYITKPIDVASLLALLRERLR